MGYIVTGDLAVTVTKTQELALALDLPNFLPDLNVVGSRNPLVVDILTHRTNFEPDGQTVDSDGTTHLNFYHSEKWRYDAVTTALDWLAGHGALIDGEFVGEEGERWAYFTRDNVLHEEGVHLIRSSRLTQLEQAEQQLTRLLTALADEPTLTDQTRALLPQPETLPTVAAAR